jgi:RimJ/RimL family protein N-acetyltransferase
MTRLGKVFDTARRFGLKGALTHLGRRALTTVPGGKAFRFFIIVLETPRPTPEAARAARDHTFRFATLEDLERLIKDPDSMLFERDIQSFNNGCRCLLQFDGTELVGYTWISSSPLFDVNWGIHFNMPDDMLYNYNGYTTPKHRGTAYQGLRHLKILELTHGEGKRRLMGYVHHTNYKSINGTRKSGYQRVGVVRGVSRKGADHVSLYVDAKSWSTLARCGPVQY